MYKDWANNEDTYKDGNSTFHFLDTKQAVLHFTKDAILHFTSYLQRCQLITITVTKDVKKTPMENFLCKACRPRLDVRYTATTKKISFINIAQVLIFWMGKILFHGLGKVRKKNKISCTKCASWTQNHALHFCDVLLAFFISLYFDFEKLWKGGPALLEIFFAVNWLLCLFCEPVYHEHAKHDKSPGTVNPELSARLLFMSVIKFKDGKRSSLLTNMYMQSVFQGK